MRGAPDRGQAAALRALRLLPCALLLLVPGSCARFAPGARGPEAAGAPAAFTLYEDTAPAPDRWWTQFHSPELDLLVDRAMEGNLGLRQIQARLLQAEMLAVQAGTARYPTLDASGDLSATRRRTDTGVSEDPMERAARNLKATGTLVGAAAKPATTFSGAVQSAQTQLQAAETLLTDAPGSAVTAVSHSYRFGLSTGFEVDLWGRVNARHQAALLDYEASAEDLRAAMLSLSGAVARQWLAITAARQELELVRRQLELNRTRLELLELRLRRGLATALDVYQQRQIVAQTESLLPPLESSLESARHELAVLLGLPPRAELGLETGPFPNPGPMPDPGLPADLLARRPDVRAAGLELRAADWRIGAARADRLPALRLTGSAAYDTREWDLLFDNWFATLAASLTGPVFDAGRRKAEVARTRAVADERLAAYRQTVLNSVKEVENALLQETRQVELLAALNRELDAARATQDQALDRYRNGLVDYLPVLSALLQIQALERRVLQAELVRLERRVQACVALGGAWMAEDTAAPARPPHGEEVTP